MPLHAGAQHRCATVHARARAPRGGTSVRSYYFDQEKFADSRAYAGLPADLDIAKCARY